MSQIPHQRLRPRSQVVDLAWRALGSGLEPLSGPDGAPLTRTVKLILLPLVLRPVLRPELAGDLLTAEGAEAAAGLLRDDGPRLVATARWFTLLKRVRRTLKVVDGNPQDLYFQRCYELATEHGDPDGPGARDVARATVEEMADRGDRTVAALREHLTDPVRSRAVADALSRSWAHRTPPPRPVAAFGPGDAFAWADAPVPTAPGGPAEGPGPEGPPASGAAAPEPAALALADAVLDGCPDPGSGAAGAAFERLIAQDRGSGLGTALWDGPDPAWGRPDAPAHLGLTDHPVPPAPTVGAGASTTSLPAPLDRSVYERVFTLLRAPGHDDLPPVPDLVAAEADRACAPLGLDDESLRVALLVGGRLAVGLDPLGSDPGPTVAHRIIDRRWRRESSVSRARRATVDPTATEGPFADLARTLRAPWAAYVRRLWARLHGRDAHGAPVGDADELWALLDGIAYSVLRDHRARVRAVLRSSGVPEAADPTTSGSAA
ncbi:hypothetical protein [Nocardiopsis lambiniae]|uniref:Uncharacterized protein n=1 Tax=Nocardiopsis lambiniae TaxID=3075539 RepID=A0ABU2MB68_9ACTN|nr:hypothetical protein [Nocardiopsis sp. DSM 44743]MDT0329924.1 hypothetical protein [Nocardiopsis sp. DSM 44743]